MIFVRRTNTNTKIHVGEERSYGLTRACAFDHHGGYTKVPEPSPENLCKQCKRLFFPKEEQK